jgi:RNA polymerase sigma-70 factor (sigma-E family)
MNQRDLQIEEFFADHGQKLLVFAISLTGNPSTAPDLLQNALVRCYPKWHTITDGRHLAYLKMIMVRENISIWRVRRWREVSHFEIPDFTNVPDSQEANAQQDLLFRALAGLPAKQRTALILRFYFDWPINEVAKSMRVESGTVKSLCSRGLIALRQDPHLAQNLFLTEESNE